MCAPINVTAGVTTGGATGGCTGICSFLPQIIASLGIVGILLWNFRNLVLRPFRKAAGVNSSARVSKLVSG